MKFLNRLAIILACSVLLSCSHSDKVERTLLRLEIPSKKLADVKVGHISMLSLDFISTAELKLDSAGRGVLNLPLDRPQFIMLQAGNWQTELYVEPGYNLHINMDTANALRYTGVGADVNEYLSKAISLEKKIEETKGGYLTQLSNEEFPPAIDSLSELLARFHRQFVDSAKLPNRMAYLLESGNSIRLLQLRQAFQFNYAVTHDFNLPPGLDMSDKIPYDSTLLRLGSLTYGLLLHMNIHMQKISGLYGATTPEEVKRIENETPKLARNKIEQDNALSPKLKEFLLAKNIYFWMNEAGISPGLDSLYSEYKSQYPTSSYLTDLSDLHKAFTALLPGAPAPPIKTVTLQGDSVGLSRFKNKVVYVDVWASWCGPCVGEIPFSIELQKAFEENDSVVFVNVSVDQDRDAWEKAMLKYDTWKGIHLLSGSSIFKTYKMRGIPRYILIDKEGRIVNADAPRPSSDDIEKEIRQLLL